jgi:hypothetical protein
MMKSFATADDEDDKNEQQLFALHIQQLIILAGRLRIIVHYYPAVQPFRGRRDRQKSSLPGSSHQKKKRSDDETENNTRSPASQRQDIAKKQDTLLQYTNDMHQI